MADLLKTQVEGLGGGKSDASHTPLFFYGTSNGVANYRLIAA